MAGNSQRRGAMRNPGSKKGAGVGSGGNRKDKLDVVGQRPKQLIARITPKRSKRKRLNDGRQPPLWVPVAAGWNAQKLGSLDFLWDATQSWKL